MPFSLPQHMSRVALFLFLSKDRPSFGMGKYRQLSENFTSAILDSFNLLKVNLAKAPILSFNLKFKVYDIKRIL